MKKLFFCCIVINIFVYAGTNTTLKEANLRPYNTTTCSKPSIKAIKDDGQYAVKLSKSWVNPKFTNEVVLRNFPKVQEAHWIKANDGNSFFHFLINTNIKNFRIFVAKNGGMGIKDWTHKLFTKPARTIERLDNSLLTLNGLLISPNPIINEAQVLENGKLIFHKEHLQKGSEILIQALGNESINAVVYFELKNNVKIQHIITDSSGHTYFYDLCGQFYNYENGMEDGEEWSVFTESIGWLPVEQ